MKPRYEESEIMKKAREVSLRIDALEKASKVNEEVSSTVPLSAGPPRTSKRGKVYDGQQIPQQGMRESGQFPLPGGKSDFNETQDETQKAEKCDCGKEPCECKNCPKCGSKMNKMGCMKMGCNKMEKAEPGYKSEKITDINPHFVAESGGQTKTGYFTTNGRTIEAEDAPKKKKGKEATDMGNLGSRMNPHEGGGIEREDSQGGKSSVQKANPRATMREAGMGICGLCGGTDRTGCLLHEGMDLHACPKFKPL